MKTKALLFLILLSFISGVYAQNTNPLKLWYNKPASKWEEALPIGNGRLGAMVFGNTGTDQLQLNEETVWAGEPGNNIPEGFNQVLPQARKLIFEGKYKEAQDLVMTKVPRNPSATLNYGMQYQPVGNLYINFPGHEQVQDYYRELDIQNATSTVKYRIGDVTYTRNYLVSAVDQVIVVRLSASKKTSITCDLRMDSPHLRYSVATKNNQLILSGVSSDVDNKKGKVKFETQVFPVLENGNLVQKDSLLHIEKADAVTIYISIGTNFKKYDDISGDAAVVASAHLNKAKTKKFDEIKKSHIQDYQKYFERVKLDLGQTEAINKPTDHRIVDFGNGDDPQLVALYFQFGRYLLISSSRPGTQPANLQGIWNDKINPPWDSKYTININTEMNYWPAEVTNMAEMHEPLFSMVKDLSVTGQESARKMYGARGWVVHHNTDLWRITGPVDGAFYGMWPMGGAWLSQHLWQHFLYSGDKKFLADVFPILKGAATFYVDVLQEEPTHKWLVVAPGMSPENTHPGNASMAAGNTMDNQLVFDVFSNLIKASEFLNTDLAFADTVRTKINRLPPMQVGQYGQLHEWLFDWDRPDDKHRHASHLYGLFPSNQISPFLEPELFQAAKKSLEFRGDKSTGWSMGWKVNFWARLLDGNRAYKLIKDQLSPAPEEKSGQSGGTYPNLFDAHPPFQIDGNFGCTSGIAEMLLQSQDGAIYVLPALPDALPNGKVSGLCARGGFIIDLAWQNGKVKELTIQSTIGGNCRLRLANELKGNVVLQKVTNEKSNPNLFFSVAAVKEPLVNAKAPVNLLELPKTMLFDFETVKGKTYHFYSKN